MLDPVVFDYMRPYVNIDYLAKGDPKVVPDTTPSNGEVLILCQVSIALLGVRLEQDLEICDNQTALKGWNMPQVVLTSHMLTHLVLLLAKFYLIFLESVNLGLP